MCAYWIIPTSLATLTNPLTLTYAAIHSQPLGIASRNLMQLNFVSRTNPSNTLSGPRGFSTPTSDPLLPYRMAKHLLHATKYVMSLALGFGGWVRTAHIIRISGAGGLRGSLYAYVVGLIAGTIGFAVLGAVENVVGAVLDAAVICWASETGGRGEARFCREAGELFGGDASERDYGV
nr:choline transporter-like protein ctl1 [Quercus suber]